MPETATAALIEIIERTDSPSPYGEVVPNEVRINGAPVLCPADNPVTIHETTIGSDVVLVSLTLFARRVVIGSEPKGDE